MSDNDSSDHNALKKKSKPLSKRRGKVLGPEIGFGERIRKARGKQRQADLAREANIAPSALAKYESGERYPGVPEFRRLCDALKKPAEHLLYGDMAPDYPPVESAAEQAAAGGESEAHRITRLMFTGLLLNMLPPKEREAFREVIWSTVSRHVGRPEVLRALFDLCEGLAEAIESDMDEIFTSGKFETHPKFKKALEDLTQMEEKEDQ